MESAEAGNGKATPSAVTSSSIHLSGGEKKKSPEKRSPIIKGIEGYFICMLSL